MPLLDIVDETYVVADPDVLRRMLCDEAQWGRWFPDLELECYDDRGDLGKRWTVGGRLVGTAEIWLEPVADGTVVHAFVQADPSARDRPRRRARHRTRGRLAKRYAVPLKQTITRLKDELEAGRGAGEPRPRPPRAGPPPRDGSLSPTAPPSGAARDAPPTRSPAMANQTTSDIVVDASPAKVMATIADFKSYPEWATGVQETEVVATGVDGRVEQVRFVLDASPIRDEYTLAYEWDDDRSVSWNLSEPGRMLRAMDGSYVLDAEAAESTRVTYRLAVEVSIPLLGMLKRKAEKVIIDTALKGLKERVEQRDGG